MNGDAGTDSLAILDITDVLTVAANPTAEPAIFLYDIELTENGVRYGDKENFTVTVNADALERTEEVIYTSNGDHQVVYEGATTLWVGSYAWRQAYTAEPPHSPFTPPADAVDVTAFFGADKVTMEVIPITCDLKGVTSPR